MAHPSQSKSHKFLRTSAILVLLAVIGVAVWYFGFHQTPTPTPAPTKSDSLVGTDNSIHTETSENQKFPVPNNVPSGSIKDYRLITDNSEYKIRELNGAYTITLYAIINNPSQADSYHQQLHDYKQAALNYLTEHGVNVNKVSITYDPPEAANY